MKTLLALLLLIPSLSWGSFQNFKCIGIDNNSVANFIDMGDYYEVDTPFTIDNYKLVYESEDILELTLLADGSKGKLTFLIFKNLEKGVLFFFDYVDYDDFPQKATYRCIEN